MASVAATMQRMAPGYVVPGAQVEEYIRQQAAARGIDPNVALRVYRGEGASNWQSQIRKNGVQEPSYGPFQLYTGGGLGNAFQRDTGLDPSDPNTWQQNVTYALDKAREGGWGPWYGAKAAGITGMMGIDGRPVAAAPVAMASAGQNSAPPPPDSLAAAFSPDSGFPLTFAPLTAQTPTHVPESSRDISEDPALAPRTWRKHKQGKAVS